MQTLQELFEYNAWANALVFSTCLSLDATSLDAPAPGTVGTITQTLHHLAQVELVYSLMLQDIPLPSREALEEPFAHDLEWYASTVTQTGNTYLEILAHADEPFLRAPLQVPWFDFALAKHDGLLQVLTHSAQHRSQILSVLGQRGLTVPDLDFVLYLQREKYTTV